MDPVYLDPDVEERFVRHSPTSIETQNYHEHSPLYCGRTGWSDTGPGDPPFSAVAAAIPHFDSVCPSALRLQQGDLESIYYTSRGNNTCAVLVHLFCRFFALFSSDQSISLQIAGETPKLVSWDQVQIVEYLIYGPKTLTINQVHRTEIFRHYICGSGDADGYAHVVLRFPIDTDTDYILDVSRLQYGEAGRGSYGENYFLDTYREFSKANTKICQRIWQMDAGEGDAHSIQERFKVDPGWLPVIENCARRALERWNEREGGGDGWCEHCGIGGKMVVCPPCLTAGIAVRYCTERHRFLAWKLHQHTCAIRPTA